MVSIKTLTFINSLGMEMIFTNHAPFLMQKFTESTNINIYNSKGMNQNGKSYKGNTLDIKDMSLEIALIGTNEEELIKYRRTVNKVFNPALDEGWLIYKDSTKEWKIKCIINKLPFPNVINNRISTALISLTANNPYWTEIEESKIELASWIPNLEFPIEFMEGGIEFGYREPSLIKNVINNGDVAIGMIIEFKAISSVVNPYLNGLNDINANEYIRMNRAMVAGETIRISTYYGKKTITSTLNGVNENVFNYVDYTSTFLQLESGDNVLTYGAESGLESLNVTIYYIPAYLGV